MDDLKQAVTEAILIWRNYWKPPKEDNVELVKSWLVMIGAVEVDQFKAAAKAICSSNTTWPKPAEILGIMRKGIEPCHRLWQEPKMLPEPPLSVEDRRRILKGVNPKLAEGLIEKEIGQKR